MSGERADLETTDLRFVCADKDLLQKVSREGFNVASLPVHDTLSKAREQCSGVILVVTPLEEGIVPPDRIHNLRPYREARPVAAAGGLVIDEGDDQPRLLMIFRRGVWDLPKGKCDAGEMLSDCAMREVAEEVGVTDLALLGPAGFTVHGYPEDDLYLVKRTSWFFMRTRTSHFTPQLEEDIERVEWFPVREAIRRVGYASLRQHLIALSAAGLPVRNP